MGYKKYLLYNNSNSNKVRHPCRGGRRHNTLVKASRRTKASPLVTSGAPASVSGEMCSLKVNFYLYYIKLKIIGGLVLGLEV